MKNLTIKMKKMKKTILRTILAAFFISTVIIGCKKDEVRPAPTISFITAAGYISTDATVFAGDEVVVGLKCDWNGTDALKTVKAYANDVIVGSPYVIPEADAQSASIEITITKTEAATEKWEFEVTDAQGEKSSVSLTLTVNTAINKIVATIGAQENSSKSGYYSLSTKLNYNAADAKTHQSVIDFIGAYDATNFLHLVSPAAPNLPEPYLTDMADWTTKNNTKFCATTVTQDVFNSIATEDLLISSFSTDPANQKNKAKNLKVGDIYSFITSGGKYGLLKVTAAAVAANGEVSIEIKIQK